MAGDVKVAVVTGGTSGIGLAVAVRLVHAGYRVVISGRDEAKAAQAIDEAVALGAPAEHLAFCPSDASDLAHASALADFTRHHFGPVDVLVNNAGTWESKPLADVDETSYDRTFAVNVKAAFFLTQALLTDLIARGGAVVNVASIAGQQGFADNTVYCATKGALISLTQAMAVELAPRGVRVNAVAPGNVETPFNAHLMADPGYRSRLIERTPVGRNGTPDDIAGCVTFLASDAASWICGEVLTVDGGWRIT